MLFWLLAGTIVFFLTVNVPALFVLRNIGVNKYVGGRDDEGPVTSWHGRAIRARRNSFENYPVFVALGILALVVPDVNFDLAVLGAQVHVIGRLFYVPAYVSGIPWVRSSVFTIGFVGTAMMFVALAHTLA